MRISMELLVDFFIDFIFDFVFEGGIEISKNRKISKWIRYPVIAVMSLLIISVIILIGYIGTTMISGKGSNSICVGLILTAFDIILIIFGTKRIIKKLKSRKPKK